MLCPVSSAGAAGVKLRTSCHAKAAAACDWACGQADKQFAAVAAPAVAAAAAPAVAAAAAPDVVAAAAPAAAGGVTTLCVPSDGHLVPPAAAAFIVAAVSKEGS